MEGERRRKLSEPNKVNILPLKKGPFHLALALKYDIVIMIIVGGTRLFGPGSIFPKPGTIYMKFCKKIKFEEVAHMDHNELREFIEKKMHENYFYKDDKEVLGRGFPSAHYVVLWFLIHFLLFRWLFI